VAKSHDEISDEIDAFLARGVTIVPDPLDLWIDSLPRPFRQVVGFVDPINLSSEVKVP
jgi:hypothetical protein